MNFAAVFARRGLLKSCWISVGIPHHVQPEECHVVRRRVPKSGHSSRTYRTDYRLRFRIHTELIRLAYRSQVAG